MNLPTFKYHPDPLSTGSVIVSDATCKCCGEKRGYIYACNVYCIEELNNQICPWCIADGSAAKKFTATFVEDCPLRQAGIVESIILEVTTKTPGYISWQQEVWLSHCNDACAFLGDATIDDVLAIIENQLEVIGSDGIDRETLNMMAQNYRPKCSPAFYKFECLHCNQNLYSMDYD